MDAHDHWLNAAHGERTPALKAWCARVGVSYPAVMARLREMKLLPARKRRADAGVTSVSEEATALHGALALGSGRANGKRLGSDADDLACIRANGVAGTDVTSGHFSRIAKRRGHHVSQLQRPTPAVHLLSEHPNHAWQFDATAGVQFFLDDGRMQVMTDEEFNKNKPANVARAARRALTKYTVVDHYSGYQASHWVAGGESALNAVSALIYFMCTKPDPRLALCGAPAVLMLDRGPGNRSEEMLRLLAAVGARPEFPKAGNARAKGMIEKSQDLGERHGDRALLFDRASSLDELNAKQLINDIAFNEHKRLVRADGVARYRARLWRENTTTETLRVPVSAEVLRSIVLSAEKTRQVDDTGEIRFGGKRYYVLAVPNAQVRDTVQVVTNAFLPDQVLVRAREPKTAQWAEAWVAIAPEQYDAVSGQNLRANIIGREWKSAEVTAQSGARADVLRVAYPGRSDDEAAEAFKRRERMLPDLDIRAHLDISNVPTRLPRAHTPIDVAPAGYQGTVEKTALVLRIKQAMGPAFDGPAVWAHLAERYADKAALLDDEAQRVFGLFVRAATVPPLDSVTNSSDRPPLRAVGGGA